MQILLTGATGLIGGHLVPALLEQGHRLRLWARRPEAARKRWPAIEAAKELAELGDPAELDVVINLAGEPIAAGRWSSHRKQQLRASRIALTHTLCQWLAAAPKPGRLLMSGSAVGVYGHGGAREITESAATDGSDFASQLCADWERSAQVQGAADRTIWLRTGLVLSPNGGLLAQLRRPFWFGLGGRMGSGSQYMPWIHWYDYVQALLFIMATPAITGPVNLTAPQPATNAEFTRDLANAMHRPAFMHVPAPILKLLLGELSELMLCGQRAIPKVLEDASFQFRFQRLEDALNNLL